MSKAPRKSSDREADDVEKNIVDSNARDWFLSDLVRIVNSSDVQFSVTLAISGGVVSGDLIGGKRYFNLFADEFSKLGGSNEEDVEALRAFIETYGTIYDNPEQSSDDDDPHLWNPQFVHLANARFFAPGVSPMPTNRGILWRGNLNQVGGFSLGRFATNDEE